MNYKFDFETMIVFKKNFNSQMIPKILQPIICSIFVPTKSQPKNFVMFNKIDLSFSGKQSFCLRFKMAGKIFFCFIWIKVHHVR